MSHFNLELHRSIIENQRRLLRKLSATFMVSGEIPEVQIDNLMSASNHLRHCLTHLDWVREYYESESQ